MEIMKLTESNFENDVIQNEQPVLIDFYATWCGPCKMLAPVLEEFAKENKTCQIGKVDVDECPNLAKEFHVMSVPTLLYFHKGKAESRVSGAMQKKELEQWIDKLQKKE